MALISDEEIGLFSPILLCQTLIMKGIQSKPKWVATMYTLEWPN